MELQRHLDCVVDECAAGQERLVADFGVKTAGAPSMP
jgi:hypothetical protein